MTRQVDDCRGLAEAKGWTVVAEHIDNDTSASSGKPRPGYRALLEQVKGAQVDAIVAWSHDRLARRVVDLEELLDLVRGRDVAVATVSGELDLSSPAGRLVAGIFANVARHEVEQKGARQVRANAQRASSGVVRWTRRPFGFTTVDGQIVVEENEADELRAAARAVLGGATLASVVRDLNQRGVRTSLGGDWSVTTLRRALLNPRAAGKAVHRGKVVGDAATPAILEPRQAQLLADHLRDPHRRVQTSTENKYLLSGLARCGICGAKMYPMPQGPKGAYYQTYRCRTTHLSRVMRDVDNFVVSVVLVRLSQPDAVDLLLDPGEDVDALRAQIVELRGRRDELAGLLAEGLLSAAAVRDAAADLTRQIDALEQRRGSLQVPALGALVTADDVAAVWERLSIHDRRAVVDALMVVTILPAAHKGARFNPENIQIEWRTA